MRADPGWGQIGTVWLPLPHLLIAPFVANDWLWRTGIGGSIPSMVAYVLGVAGIYRLVRARASLAAAALAAAIYAFNPSMLYMQSTAMTESIFLAAVIWSLVYFDDFLRGLIPGAAAAASPPGAPLSVAASAWPPPSSPAMTDGSSPSSSASAPPLPCIAGFASVLRSRRSDASCAPCISFLLLLALCPTLWLAHNYKTNQRPLDWLNGPYSAKAIEKRSSRPTDPPYPGKDHPAVAAAILSEGRAHEHSAKARARTG